MRTTGNFTPDPLRYCCSRARSGRADHERQLSAVRIVMSRRGALLAALTISALWTIPSPAEGRQPVYYAGLAFLGDFQYVDANYPLTRKLNEGQGALDAALAHALRAAE